MCRGSSLERSQTNIVEAPYACGADIQVKPLRRIVVKVKTPRGETGDVLALPDTGANINIVPAKALDDLNIRKESVRQPSVAGDPVAADGRRMRSKGTVKLEVRHKKMSTTAIFVIMESPQWILGLDTLKDIGLVSRRFPDEQMTCNATHRETERGWQRGDRNKEDKHRNHQRDEQRTCFCCGEEGHVKKQCNRRFGRCEYCHKTGHSVKTCFEKQARKGRNPEREPEVSEIQEEPEAGAYESNCGDDWYSGAWCASVREESNDEIGGFECDDEDFPSL